MTKHTLSLHLTDSRKQRLDSLIAHSEYEGHGAQSEFLRALIDEAASDHPEINFENPEVPVGDDKWEYHPIKYDGLLTQNQVREVLNTEKAPAINPEHCPPTWKPRDKSDKAVLMVAFYRYYHYLLRRDENSSINEAIEIVSGKTSVRKKKTEYKESINRVLRTYGDEPSNVVMAEGFALEEWIQNVDTMLNAGDTSDKNLTEQMRVGKEIRQELDETEDDQLLLKVESTLDELREQKESA